MRVAVSGSIIISLRCDNIDVIFKTQSFRAFHSFNRNLQAAATQSHKEALAGTKRSRHSRPSGD